jgi:hypothetical protein
MSKPRKPRKPLTDDQLDRMVEEIVETAERDGKKAGQAATVNAIGSILGGFR